MRGCQLFLLLASLRGVRPISAAGKEKKQKGAAEGPGPIARLSAIPRAWRRRAERTGSLGQSFFCAVQGLRTAFESERNLKIHALSTVAVIGVGIALRIDATGWALLFLAVGIVVCTELVNTALERVVDLVVGGEFNRLARDAKDIAAGAVLLASLAAAGIGLAVFVPAILALLHRS